MDVLIDLHFSLLFPLHLLPYHHPLADLCLCLSLSISFCLFISRYCFCVSLPFYQSICLWILCLLLLLSFCLSLGMVLSQCLSLFTYHHPCIPSHTLPSPILSPQDPTNGYYKVRGVSVSLSLGEAPGGGLFLPPSSPLGPPGTPTFYDFNPHLGMVPPCRLYRARAGYLTTPHPRAFTSYIKPTSFGSPDLAPSTPPFPYAAFPTPSHPRLQTHG